MESEKVANIQEFSVEQIDPIRLDGLSSEQRERIKAIQDLKRRGLTNAAIAKLLGCGEATVYRDWKLLREIYVSRGSNIAITEEVGSGIELYDEIVDKAMEGYRAAIEDSTDIDDKTSKPDHAQANRYLMTALSAKKHKMDLLIEIGMAQMMSKAMDKKIGPDGAIDISKLRTVEELRAVEDEMQKRSDENERKIHELDGPNPFTFDSDEEYEKAKADHNQKFEEYLAIKNGLKSNNT